MMKISSSSRQQFEQYKSELRDGTQNGDQARQKAARDRSSLALISSFLQLLRGHRLSLCLSLATLSVGTLLALLPPAATKFVIDYILTQHPLPAMAPHWLPREPWPLLLLVTGLVLGISYLRIAIQLWGRWHATRVTKLLQMSVRKQVLAHAIRLPMHRVQELKSGGAASLLRQDAGGVGDLVFGMLYNPWRAVIQFSGSLCVLAWVDWRLLLGSLGIVPLVYFTHQTWISRIRPQHRRVRAQREKIDGLTTESFGGIRVVRAFGRQRAETSRIMRGNHLMGRQELWAWWSTRVVELVWETLMPTASAALMLYGGWRVLQGQLTLGDLMMFLVYLLMLLGPLAVLRIAPRSFRIASRRWTAFWICWMSLEKWTRERGLRCAKRMWWARLSYRTYHFAIPTPQSPRWKTLR